MQTHKIQCVVLLYIIDLSFCRYVGECLQMWRIDILTRMFSTYLNPLIALAPTICSIDYTAQGIMNTGILLLLFKSATTVALLCSNKKLRWNVIEKHNYVLLVTSQ